MGDEELHRVRRIFELAVDVDGADRERVIAAACGDDEALRREVWSLLAADERAGEFLDRPATHDLPAAEDLVPLPVNRVGPYRIRRRIGSGGMSDVFLAVRDDDEFDRQVAIKLVRWAPGSDELLTRFRVERQILAGLDHPHIATMLDGGTTEHGLPYFVMEHIDGVPIDEYCDRRRLSVRQRVEMFRLVCSAVQYAHRNLIVHRDIKASNILVDDAGVPKLLDFGIAKLLDPESSRGAPDVTHTSERPMTPRWASPEQVLGRTITTSTDVYSLGVLLYKLLTGHLPYRERDGTPDELKRLVVEAEPERPSTSIFRRERDPTAADGAARLDPRVVGDARWTNPQNLARQLAGDLDRIMLMALRKEPERRYASVDQFSEDLRRWLSDMPVLARPDTWRYRTAKFARRNWIAVGVALAFVALLAGFAVAMTIQAGSIRAQRDEARRERDRAERVQQLLQQLFSASDPLVGSTEQPTAISLLDRGAERVERELQNEPEMRAALMHTIGVTYRNLGAFARARAMLEGSLQLRLAQLGPDSAETATTMAELGELEQLEGGFDRSATLLTDAIATWRAATPTPSPREVAMLNDLGATLRQLGRLDDAEARYREALSYAPALGDHDELATAMNNLATLLLQTNRQAEAERLFRDVLDVRRRLLGDEHPFVAQTLSNLGATLGIQGRYDEAEPLLRDALAMYRRLLDPDHPAMLEGLNNLGKLLHRTGDHDAAEALFMEAIETQRARLGDDHPKIAHIWSNLAEVAEDAGNLDSAETRLRRALEISRTSLGGDHPDVALTLVNLGRILTGSGRATEAEPLLRDALSIVEIALGPDHFRSAEARSVLGACLVARGSRETGLEFLRRGVQDAERALGAEHPLAVAARRRLAAADQRRR